MKKVNHALGLRYLLAGCVCVGYLSFSYAAQDTTLAIAADSVNQHLEKASQDMESQNRDAAITELMKAIKEQQQIIEKLQQTPPAPSMPPQTYSNYSGQSGNDSNFINQLKRSLPLIGGSYSDVEDQWRKAYALQHKGIFDLSRMEAKPVFQQAIKEYRVVVEQYPASKRAPQAQRQIAWIYRSQLKDNEQSKIEWNKLLQLFPNSEYATEAHRELADLEEK